MDDSPSARMLASLRKTFNERLPAGLSSAADSRLQRTLSHYLREVVSKKGHVDEQEILRESYDSMAGWFRRNTSQLSPVFRQGAEAPRAPPVIEHAVAPDMGSGLNAIGSQPWQDTHDDQLDIFERFKSQRTPPVPSPVAIPELQPLETRLKAATATQQKDILQKQEDVVKYRDTEVNLILSSKDRDWLNGPSTQNRYNFSVQFDSTRPQSTGALPTLIQRLRNIVRIEFVKVILPVEALRMVVPRKFVSETVPCEPTTTNAFFSVLGLPSVTVLLDEHQGNNIGTSNTIDRSLAVCQYDATWRSDCGIVNGSHGFTAFIPKFMKAQRVYAPTPLSNFQRLSFQLTDPEAHQLSTCADSNRIARIVSGADVSGSCYYDASGEYLFIQATEYFPVWAYSQLDVVVFDGLTYGATDPVFQTAGKALLEWLQRPEGHVVVGTAWGAYDDPVARGPDLLDGANNCGYSNFLIIRNRFADPTTGDCALLPFSTGSEADFFTDMRKYPKDWQGGGVLNLSRQVQITLRVITREYDGASNLRPDNV
jgi:hypothetical protein